MKARDVLMPAVRDVLGRHTVATGGTGAMIASDEPITQTLGALFVIGNLIADLVIEVRKRRLLKSAQPCAPRVDDAQ